MRLYYFEKFKSLKVILKEEFSPEAILDKSYQLQDGKIISRIYVTLPGVDIHNKKDWPKVQLWLYKNMDSLERFFLEYRDFVEQ